MAVVELHPLREVVADVAGDKHCYKVRVYFAESALVPPSNHAGGFPSSLDHPARASCGEGASATRPSLPAPVAPHGEGDDEVGVVLGGVVDREVGLVEKVAAEIGSLEGTEEWVVADLEAEHEEELQTEMVHPVTMQLNVPEMGMDLLV